MKTVESSLIGTLNQNEQFQDWWHSIPVAVDMLGQELPITLMGFDPTQDEQFLEEAELALENFLGLSATYRLQIAQPVFENFVEFISYVNEADIPEKMKGTSPLSIWNFVYPTAIYASRRQNNDKDIYIVLACECEWEKEHGLQLVFKQGKKLTRVSDQDGHLTEEDAYGGGDS